MSVTGQIFVYGMITAFCILGAFEAVGYKPLIEVVLPWWVYAVGAGVAMALAIIKGVKANGN